MTTVDVCPALRVKASDPALFERAHALAIGYLESVVDRRVFPDADALAGFAAGRDAILRRAGWDAASPRFRHLTEGAALADSWSSDAHKTLNAPYDNGLIFCRDREALVCAMKMAGSYIVFSEDRDGMGLTPEMSRRARGIEIWACLKSLGRDGLASLVDHLCCMASAFGTGLAAEGFSIRNVVVFNQVLVACEDQELTRATLANLQASGECWCGGTTWRGGSAIRISCCSFMTTKEDVDRSVRAFVAARTAARIGRV